MTELLLGGASLFLLNCAMLGLKTGIVQIVPYDPAWETLFAAERERIAAAIGSYVLAIEHVGSTAVPNLAAKPILDIAIGVAALDIVPACVGPLEGLGYEYKGENGLPERHYFTRGVPLRTHHLHLVVMGQYQWSTLVPFRDHLRRNPQTLAEYQQLKEDLAAQFPHDRAAYTDGKAKFIQAVLRQESLSQ